MAFIFAPRDYLFDLVWHETHWETRYNQPSVGFPQCTATREIYICIYWLATKRATAERCVVFTRAGYAAYRCSSTLSIKMEQKSLIHLLVCLIVYELLPWQIGFYYMIQSDLADLADQSPNYSGLTKGNTKATKIKPTKNDQVYDKYCTEDRNKSPLFRRE